MKTMQVKDNKLVVAAMAAVVMASLVAAPAILAKASEDDVAKVKVGMSPDEVLQIMGRPNKDQKVQEGELCRLFVYRSVGRYKIVNVWFDCSDKVKAVDKVSG